MSSQFIAIVSKPQSHRWLSQDSAFHDIALVSAQDGALQCPASTPLQQIDPIAPDADALVAPFTSLKSSQHLAELTVLVISTQVRLAKRYDVLPKIELTTDGRFTIDYIGAYVAGLKAGKVASAPCLFFIEITPTIFTAQLVTIHLEDTKRIRVPVHVKATTFTSTATLPTFVGKLFAWAQGHNHKLFQCILLDPPSGSVDGTALETALAPDCPIIIVNGAQLAKYAASYAFLNLEDLRQPREGGMAQYAAPSPISFVANNGPPTLIIHLSEPLPAVCDITFTTTEENQTSIAVKFAFGTHDARPDGRLIFAKVTLEGLRPRPVGQGQITLSAFVSPNWGNTVEVFQGSERENADVRTVVLIPYPFDGHTYAVVQSILS